MRLAAATLGVLNAVDAPCVDALVVIRVRTSDASGVSIALDAVLCGDRPLAVAAAGGQQGGHEQDRAQRAHAASVARRSPALRRFAGQDATVLVRVILMLAWPVNVEFAPRSAIQRRDSEPLSRLRKSSLECPAG